MKKYLVLTFVLALTACGGGSGGAGNPGMRVSGDAIISNTYVTSMASEILIAKDGVSPSIVRSSTVTDNGKEYTAYHLDDAKFFDIGMESDDEFIFFDIDDTTGQINKMSSHWTEAGHDVIESVNRESEDNSVFTENVYKFHVTVGLDTYYTDSLIPRTYSKSQIQDAFRDAYEGEVSDDTLTSILNAVTTNMVPTEYVHRHVIDLQGNDMPESKKLRYSDFGYTTILEKEVHQPGDGIGDDNSLIYGGYEIKEIQNPTNLQSISFTGKAVAALGNVHNNADTRIETDDTATVLSFDANGDQTLQMPFNDYYTINVNKPHNSNSYTINWTGSSNVGYALNGSAPINNSAVVVKYYGDNGNPSEAVGGVTFQNNNVEFNAAFGVTR